MPFDLSRFTHWVESLLSRTPFLPQPDAGARVVLTPLARCYGRLWGHIVMPGADAQRLGPGERSPSLLGDAAAKALGLEHAGARRALQRLALAQVLQSGPVTLLRRHRDGDEPLAESPDIEWLRLTRARLQLAPWPARDWVPATRPVEARPVAAPLPRAAGALPAALSASQLEAMRQCPYRFYARAVLRLDEPEELDSALAKRDYGTWLHAVLHRFHLQRDPSLPDAPQLRAAADAITAEGVVDPAEWLPYRASFEAFGPAYLAWLSGRDADGWTWHSGETDHLRPAAHADEPGLRGRVDRIDHGPGGQRQLLDYKTGSLDDLKKKVKEPLEDVQLAFYAALLGGGEEWSAAYLALDDPKAPVEVAHPEVHRTAALLLEGLRGEWARLRQGAPLPALGMGRVCETCEARGLCRRDHWAPA
jgi:ATP-dependent helicase/nuclease subunit B